STSPRRSALRRSAAARAPSSRGCRGRSRACGWSWRAPVPELETQLRALGEELAWPATPDLAAAVAAAPRRRAPRLRRPTRRALAAALAVLLLIPAAAV